MINYDAKSNVLKSLIWVLWLSIFSFAGFIVTIIILCVYLNDEHFKQLILFAILLFVVPWILSSIMFTFCFRQIDIFDKLSKINKLTKILTFIPVVNISIIYFYFCYSKCLKNEVKELQKSRDANK